MSDLTDLLVAQEHHLARLDCFLRDSLPALSRTRLKNLIEGGFVQVGDKVIKTPSLKVHEGQDVKVHVPPIATLAVEPQDIPLDILYEDADVLVLNKPVGLVVHPAPGHPDETLVNALLAHCGASLSGIGGVSRPGIVHRLDKGTSGLMVVAKHDEAHQKLSAQFADRTLTRKYMAFVWGRPPLEEGTIDQPLGRSPHHRQKMSVRPHGGKQAVTLYRVLETFGLNACLVECSLKTGRTHQIRVHMAFLGHGLLGDGLYASVPRRVSPPLRAHIKKMLDDDERPALHAFALTFRHPRTDQKMKFKVPMPQDLVDLQAFLEDQI